MMHAVPSALISYLLGDSCVLSSMVAMVKGPGTRALPLHVDNGPGVPEPLPPYAQVANATWILSDYTVENGPLCFVPGSHHLCRHPAAEEADPRTNPLVVPIEAPKGSLVVFHGNLFHGALPRTAPGLRLNLIMFFTRMYFRPQEDYTNRITPEMLARNTDRFASLVGLTHPFPADPVTGINARDVAALSKTSYSIYA
jgi:ectoine hydroxylase-related dioxygenase (phytanoyl-CoA dioxygenase family)